MNPRGPTKKTLAYMRRMISYGSWKANTKIPKISDIANTLSVSYNTVRNVIRMLEHEKTIENYGTMGFYVVSDILSKSYIRNRNIQLLHMASVNLNLSRAAQDKRKLFGSYAIKYNSSTQQIEAYNVITHKKVLTSVDEVNEIIFNTITIERMIESTDSLKLPQLKSKYRRQQQLQSLAKVIHLNRGELGINE